jgi:hypothetical protein
MGRVRALNKEFKEQFNIEEKSKLLLFNDKTNLHEIEQREGVIGMEFDTEDSFRIKLENAGFYEY